MDEFAREGIFEHAGLGGHYAKEFNTEGAEGTEKRGVTEVMEDLVVDGAQRCCAPIGKLLFGGVGFGCGVGVFLLEALDAAGSVY